MTKSSIPLGLVFSRTGPYAMMAGEMEKSALMAVDEVNRSADGLPTADTRLTRQSVNRGIL